MSIFDLWNDPEARYAFGYSFVCLVIWTMLIILWFKIDKDERNGRKSNRKN